MKKTIFMFLKVILIQILDRLESFFKDNLDVIPSTPPSVKIQIMGGKVCLRCKVKTLLGDVSQFFVFKSLLTMRSDVLILPLRHTFLALI